MTGIHPATPLGSPPAATTPGQAAYEAYRHFPGPTMMPLGDERFAWERLQADDREAWEHAAIVAIRCSDRVADYVMLRDRMYAAIAERDQLQAAHNALSRKNAELAAELDRTTRQCDDLHVQVDQLRSERNAYRELLSEAGIADTTPAEDEGQP